MLNFFSTMAVSEIFESGNSTDTAPNGRILYPSSSVDLIVNYFKSYKHVKRLTLFLCDDSSTHFSIPIHFDYNAGQPNSNAERQMQNDKAKLKQQQHHDDDEEHHGNCCLNFQQIVKYLMASGNFLIKGDGNIDATMFTTSGNGCNNDALYEKLDSVYAYSLTEMLKSGDFKQGVVLDLRCRQSRFILQQVNNDPAIKTIQQTFCTLETSLN